MKITALHLIYFSATGTTEKISDAIARGTGVAKVTKHHLLSVDIDSVAISNDELAIFAVPVYSGRVPALVAEQIRKFHADSAPAIIAVVYGNREFDDALLELRDIVTESGFDVISAGAFVAQHSIFPAVGRSRPDESDIVTAFDFGKKSTERVTAKGTSIIEVIGNNPYRKVASIPLRPKGSSDCNGCGICVKRCPTGAISLDAPRKTDKKRCISCARCIALCPQQARRFGGLLYTIVSKKFVKNFSEPKSPYIVYR